MKNTSRKEASFFIFFMILVFWAKAPDVLAIGTNKVEAPIKNQIPGPSLPVSEPIQVIVPAGTPLKVQLNQSIRTATHRTGESFFATLKNPVIIGGQVLFQTGVPLIGVISQSRESGHFSGSPLIEIQLTRIIIPDGTTVPLTTETFKKTGQAHFFRNIGLISGGIILGAGLGNLLRQIPGALIGIGFGGGTGAVLAYVTGKEDLFIKAGTDLDFKLARPLTLPIPPSSAIPSK